MNKVVLFLSTSIPPFAESHTIRNVFFINALIERGYEVIVVTGEEKKGDVSLYDFLNTGVKILRTSPSFYSKIQSNISNLNLKPRIASLLKSSIAISSSYLLWPDVWAGWDKKAIKLSIDYFAKDSTPALIVSSSGSFTAHLAAKKLSIHFNVPWVADYGDPWYLNPLGPQVPWFKLLSWSTEHKLINQCTAVSFTTSETGAAYKNWLGKRCPPIEIIPCGYHGNNDQGVRPDKQKFVIAYVGSAGAMTRNLGSFMERLDETITQIGKRVHGNEVVFRIVGSSSPLFVRTAKKCKNFIVEFAGWVSYQQSIDEINSADALLLMGNKSANQIPGKVYQYLYSKKPLIYWSQMEKLDPTRNLLSKYSGIVDCGNDNTSQKKSIACLFDNYDSILSQSKTRYMALAAYSWANLGAHFAKLCTGLVKSQDAS